jgi:hypothetical protein
MRRRKGGDHILAAFKSIRAARNKVEVCLTPTSASWANPIEARFGPLRAFTMANSDYPNHTVLAVNCMSTCAGRNADARHPDVRSFCGPPGPQHTVSVRQHAGQQRSALVNYAGHGQGGTGVGQQRG